MPEIRSVSRCSPTGAAPWASFRGLSELATTTSSQVRGVSPIAHRSFSYSCPTDALRIGESQSPSRWRRGPKGPHKVPTLRCACWAGRFGRSRNGPRSKRRAGAVSSLRLRGRRRKKSIDCPAGVSMVSNRRGRCSAARRSSVWPERNSLPAPCRQVKSDGGRRAATGSRVPRDPVCGKCGTCGPASFGIWAAPVFFPSDSTAPSSPAPT